jgi:cellulase/cellobiase CelA1
MRPPQLTIATLAVSVLSAGCAGGNSGPAPEPRPATGSLQPPMPEGSIEVTVKEVKDARTVLLSNGAQIRITGLAEPGACWAESGTAFARTTLLDKNVRVTESAPDASPLWLPDGTDYALLAVGAGAMRTDSTDYPAFQQAEQSAASSGLGLWGPPCNAQPAAVPPSPTTTAATTTTPPPPPAVALPAPKTAPKAPPKPAATPAPPPPPPPAPPAPTYGCRVTYRVTNQWNGSFRTDVTIANTGSAAVNGWMLTWVFGAGQAVNNMWNATYRQSGGWVGASNVDYNRTIPPGGSLLIGFTATNGPNNPNPSAFSLNGRACATG